MDDAKRQRLEAKGWQVGTVTDFLKLTPEEEAIVEFKLALSHRLKEIRKNRKITQQSLANRMNSSQSRIAKIEAGDPSASLELLIRGLLCVGATKSDIAQAIPELNKTNIKEQDLVTI
jgi:DNA-binding XRE family transcriptional regulator